MTDEKIIAYLLEELPDKELELFEDECFEQESWPDQVSLAEEELVDAYLRDELSRERRVRFENNYLVTEARQERVRMAAALLRRIDEYNAESQTAAAATPAKPTWAERRRAFWVGRTPAFQMGMAVVIVAVVAGALWLYLSRNRSPRTFFPLTLQVSKSNRGDAAQSGQVRLPLDADALRIELILPEPSRAERQYRVTLESDKEESQPLAVAGQNSQSVTVIVPSAQLTRGQFALKLFAIKPDGTEQRVEGNYLFIVE